MRMLDLPFNGYGIKILLVLLLLSLLGAITACSPLKIINTLTPGDTFTKKSDIAYGDDSRQKLDVYTPLDLHAKAPVVVFFYGGNWDSGSRQDYGFVGEALASRGIVAVIADYRLYPQVRYPAFLEDSAGAVAWAAANVQNHGGDPKKLFVMGHSAGAYNAAMVALDQRWLGQRHLDSGILRGWIGLAGPYDFIPIANEEVRPVFFYPDTPVDSQPINQVRASLPPALLIASSSDKLVNPKRNTGGLAQKLREAGVQVDEIYFDRTGHASLVGAISRPLRFLAPVLDDVERFVKSDGGRTSSASQ